MGQTREQRLINDVMGARVQKLTPIANEMFLPNHSGIKSHPQAKNFKKRIIILRCLPQEVDCAADTDIYGDFEIPVTGYILEVGAYVDTAGTTGTMVVDLNLNGNTIMATNKISIDSAEKTSRTAATPPVLTITSVSEGDILTVDIDSIHTTAAKGLTIRIEIEEI